MTTQLASSARRTSRRPPRTAWAGYAACVWGLIFAGVSFYWGSGGTALLDTIGGTIEKMARAADPSIYVAVWVTGLLKVVGAVLALAFVRPWGRRFRRVPVTILGWIAAALPTLYGGLLISVDALAASGAIKPAQPIARKPLLWHLWVWDMSFLIWGILFALAFYRFCRTASMDRSPGMTG